MALMVTGWMVTGSTDLTDWMVLGVTVMGLTYL
jgi:hypothetical protein